MQSFGRSMGVLKTHKYKTQADLINLKPEEIIRIPLTDFGNYIETETGNVALDENQAKALRRLLLFKKNNIPKNGPVPEKMIDAFLDTLPNVEKMAAAYKDETKSKLDLQSLQRRNDALNVRLPEPVTPEEALQRRWVKLGGKTRRKRRKSRRNRKSKQLQKRKTKQSQKRICLYI